MRRLLAVATVAALAGTAAALAASPQSLLLQKSDLPGGAKRQQLTLGKNGTTSIPKVGRVRAAGALWISRRDYVGTAAGIFTSSSNAEKAYARFRKSRVARKFQNIRVSGLGDEQVGLGFFSPSVSSALVLVRKGPVIWETSFSTVGKRAKSAVVSSLLGYARKQKARVD
jgi:hypothetical protein